MKQTIKPGDIVRLTDDPFSNGEIVRIESVDEYGFANFLAGSKAANMEQISIVKNGSPIGNDIDGYYFTLSEIVQEVEKRVNEQKWLKLKKPFKLYPESAVEWLKRRAEIAEESIARSKDYIKKVCKESSEDIQKLDAENKKLKEELSRCRAANADYLTAKTEAENRAKILEKEVADDNESTKELGQIIIAKKQEWCCL
ncbi:MAG: hypothetical protein II937_13540 [Bacteroidales bacterium]|nr:hypothetical protein [Bacteroidales bacterium]